MTKGDPIEWGRKLIETHDHDPLYTALHRWNSREGDVDRIKRFMVAYWCLYHVGAAWYISSKQEHHFWEELMDAAANKRCPFADRWPRGAERRHWRGGKCIESVRELRARYPKPEHMVEYLAASGEPTLEGVQRRMAEHHLFGPWIGFKAADMLERVLGTDVRFPADVCTMYRDPAKGAAMAGEMWGCTPQQAVERLLHAYRDMPAPPSGDRKVNVQEVETVLCKWKSKRYELGQDTREHSKALAGWGGHDLLNCYPLILD